MLRSKSLPHVDLKRFKLIKQASNSSQMSQVIKWTQLHPRTEEHTDDIYIINISVK